MAKKVRRYFQGGLNIKKLTGSILVLALFEICMVVYCVLITSAELPVSAMLLAACSAAGAVVSIGGALALYKSEGRFRDIEKTVDELEEFNRTLRAQRHDFKNHVQVMSALLDMEEYDEAKEYIRKVSQDLARVGRTMKTSQPAVNALLQAKSLLCQKEGVAFEMDITTRLDTLPVEPWELCRALGNLIDNAMEAQKAAQAKDPVIRVSMFEKDDSLNISVFNSGTFIPEENRKSIFQPDVSTKGRGRGLGLAIVSSVVTGCGGSVTADSDAQGVTFTMVMPKLAHSALPVKE